MLYDFYRKNKLAIWFTIISYLLYTTLTIFYYLKTNVFYNTGKFDILFDSDTGIIFKGDWFYGTAADLRHFLFRNFLSPFVFPIKLIFGTDALQSHPTIYGLYLAQIQTLFMSVNTFFVMKILNDFAVTLKVKILIGIIFILSWEQIFFALNIERYFLGQFSLLLFLFLVQTKKTQSAFHSALAGILLIGTTITNIYLYFAQLLLEKMSWSKKIQHLFIFCALFYFVLLFGGGGPHILDAFHFFNDYTGKFTDKYSLLELPGKVFTNLLYPAIFPPLIDESIRDAFFQSGQVKWLPSFIVASILLISIYTIWKKRRNRFVLLLGSILLATLVLHGVAQFGLRSAALYSTHFNFVFILLAGIFSTLLTKEKQKWFTVFLTLWLIVNLFETTQLFASIYDLGMKYYPRP
ncbi:hypothetical protein J2S13_001654 [Oikeobacillus pervagus]|uniref:Uncharacterized protein n=1 Tax=Oikeobacillus pervagus TaxID=1325931 RepID=A0AAJ1SYQ3_9BACI|nr:DUF6080 domain-containing protein [Oikeobacillus pervagus]MDQ0215254.1 hypothetical protein [Oikeobacillus pervagus]